MAKTLRLILGDQLNHQHSWFIKKDDDVIYIMMEVMQEQNYVKHHIQKIAGFFKAMRNFAEELREENHQIIYYKLDDKNNLQNFKENIEQEIQKNSIENFEYQLPDEYRLDEQIKDFCKKLDIKTAVYETEHFYTHREDVKDFFSGKKQYLMESFYRDMRKKNHILVDKNL
jgi:deoxyribodipyrimidine photolyase-related protein